MTTLLGVTLAGLALSAEAQEIIKEGITTGRQASSEEQRNKMHYENAESLPLPTAPDHVAEQAKKDLIDNLTKGLGSGGAGPVGHEPGSEGQDMIDSAQSGTPDSAIPRRNDNKGRK